MKEITPENIILVQVIVYRSSIEPSEEFIIKPTVPNSFEVNYKQNTGFNVAKQIVRIRLNIALEGVDKEGKAIGISGRFGIEFIFMVKGLNDYVTTKGGKKVVSSLLGSTIMGIVYSTARGIILERSMNTYLNGAILPVIDPKVLLNNERK